MAEDKIVERLRKLLALTTSPNENEASSAAAMLEKFLTQHNLSIADLEKKGAATAPPVGENRHDLGKAAFKWKLDLAEGIAEFYYCAPLVDRARKTVAFVGRPDNVESLQMLYGWVIDQIKEISKHERRKHYDTTGEHIDPLRWQLGFGEGAVRRLIIRLREMRARDQEDMSRNAYGDVTALAIHHQGEVSDYLEKEYGYRTDGKPTKARLEQEARWVEYDRKAAERKEHHDKLKADCGASGDMEPYYAEFPDQHPDAVARRNKEVEKWRKKDERNARRRTGPAYRETRGVDWEKESQSGAARKSGEANADRINLKPFIGDGKKATKGVIG